MVKIKFLRWNNSDEVNKIELSRITTLDSGVGAVKPADQHSSERDVVTRKMIYHSRARQPSAIASSTNYPGTVRQNTHGRYHLYLSLPEFTL